MPDYGDIDPNTGRPSARTGFEGTVDPLAPSVANGQISPAQWAEYQAKRRRDAILGILGVAGATTGLGLLGQTLTGAGAAGAAGSAAGGTLPPIAGGSPWAVTPYATTATMAGTGLGAGTAGGAGLMGGLSGRELAALGTSLAGTIGGALSKPQNMNPTTATADPQLQAVMQAMQRRLDKSEPLYDSVLAMANGLLPMQYQKGGGGMP
jgi:hypothetical protein